MLTQIDMAAELGVSRGAVQGWLSGRYAVPAHLAGAMARLRTGGAGFPEAASAVP